MVLRRNGSKTKIADIILKFFPEHKIYIEYFFGAGGLFFNKPKVKHNFLNDIDDDIFNLFIIIKSRRFELEKAIEELPVHQSLMKYWKKKKEIDPIMKAVRFLFLSNFTYLAKGSNLKFTADNSKSILLNRIEPTFKALKNTKMMCCDFRDVLKNISFQCDKGLTKKSDCFIYADPPYQGTNGWYEYDKFNESDFVDLLENLIESKIRFALSEFDSECVLKHASNLDLQINKIGERRNLKNRRMELLITNYQIQEKQIKMSI